MPEMPRGVLVEEIERGSPLERDGLRAGDRLLSINGREVEDHLDVRFHGALGDLDLEVDRGGEKLRFRVPERSYPFRGARFEEIRPKRCGSQCIFCFIDQLPPGVRPSLLVKDEDYRLSFLHGNYVTLGTLKDRDIERIVEQRLSPLYVSVHATNDDVRHVMLGRKPKRPLLPTLDRLLSEGIQVWGQIVFCPGVNDGDVLDDTIETLFGRHPGFQGVAVVPLGLSDHRKPDPLLRSVTKEIARAALRRIHDWQDRLLDRGGTRFVFGGDEFYLKAELPLPPSEAYEEFGMLEDGIGMIRNFEDLFGEEMEREREGRPRIRDLTVATGALFAPPLAPMLRGAEEKLGVRLPLLPVTNGYLGSAVTVAGLVSGRDLVRASREGGVSGALAIPAEMVSRANGLLIDDYTPDRVREEAGLEALHVVDGPEGLFRLLFEGLSDGDGAGTYPVS
ncbi:MAG: DUF512 domain-containing protein [Candidatus Eisenbacteria bacterium]